MLDLNGPLHHAVTVGRLRELLSDLADDAYIQPSRLQNLGVFDGDDA